MTNIKLLHIIQILRYQNILYKLCNLCLINSTHYYRKVKLITLAVLLV